MPPVITTASQVQCMHGGMAVLTTTNSLLTADGALVMLASDIPTVAGCGFVVGTVPSPCLTIEWSGEATSLKVNGTGVLIETSIGKCMSAAGAPQGVAIVSGAASVLEAI
jgi:hypothetical protein